MKPMVPGRVALLFAAALAAVLATVMLGLGDAGPQPASGPRLLHTEPSEFAPVVVFEQYGERCMNFVEMEGEGRQTCLQLDDPDKLVFEYTRMMVSALFAKPDPETVLVIGLGGATLPTALHKILPEAVIDSVEIDPAVVRVARRYFGYETGPRQRVFVEDGREFVERARREGRRYDMVMLDAFDVDYIPPQLLTVEFLETLKGILAPGGFVVTNSFAQSGIYARESATYAAVFGEFFNLRAGLEGNRVIIASAGALPDAAEPRRNAEALARRLRPFGIELEPALARFATQPDRHEGVEVLRDDR